MLRDLIYLPAFYQPNKAVKRFKDMSILRYIKLLFLYTIGSLIPRKLMELDLLFV